MVSLQMFLQKAFFSAPSLPREKKFTIFLGARKRAENRKQEFQCSVFDMNAKCSCEWKSKEEKFRKDDRGALKLNYIY